MYWNKLLTWIIVLQVGLLFSILFNKLEYIMWRRVDELGSFYVNLRGRHIDCELIMVQGDTMAEASQRNDSKKVEVNKSSHL